MMMNIHLATLKSRENIDTVCKMPINNKNTKLHVKGQILKSEKTIWYSGRSMSFGVRDPAA